MEIKTMTLSEFEAVKDLPLEILSFGYAYCVDGGDAGKFYVVRDEDLAKLSAEVNENRSV